MLLSKVTALLALSLFTIAAPAAPGANLGTPLPTSSALLVALSTLGTAGTVSGTVSGTVDSVAGVVHNIAGAAEGISDVPNLVVEGTLGMILRRSDVRMTPPVKRDAHLALFADIDFEVLAFQMPAFTWNKPEYKPLLNSLINCTLARTFVIGRVRNG
ncbi:hypothetical protein DFH11DRAFT_1540894 [Phellopilus nigrolimitatus]|nr:hypothetical protein DFH11DRAFT_1540894 [Phellopilus nigrolimitatus]